MNRTSFELGKEDRYGRQKCSRRTFQGRLCNTVLHHCVPASVCKAISKSILSIVFEKGFLIKWFLVRIINCWLVLFDCMAAKGDVSHLLFLIIKNYKELLTKYVVHCIM